LENKKRCIHNTPFFVTGFAPYEFRWILTGNRTAITAKEVKFNHMNLEHLDNDLRKFWEIETIGITPNQQKTLKVGDSQLLQEFRDTYRIEQGRRIVHLPLNDVLEMGPKLLPEVLATLLRFRGHPVAVICDIQQAFLQLSLDRKDRDLISFL